MKRKRALEYGNIQKPVKNKKDKLMNANNERLSESCLVSAGKKSKKNIKQEIIDPVFLENLTVNGSCTEEPELTKKKKKKKNGIQDETSEQLTEIKIEPVELNDNTGTEYPTNKKRRRLKKEKYDAEESLPKKTLPGVLKKIKIQTAQEVASGESGPSDFSVRKPKKKDDKKDKKGAKKGHEDVKFGNGVQRSHISTTDESDLEVYDSNKKVKKEETEKSKTPKNPIAMPKEDQLILVQRMQLCTPPNETKSHKCSVQNLDWTKICFKNYSLEDCQAVWAQLLKKVRHYRILSEIICDVKKVIETVDMKEVKVRKTKSSNKRHPDMPKRPQSSFFLYYINEKDKVAKEHPDLDTAELQKYISKKYHNLSPEKKQKYELLSTEKMEEYKRQLEEFYAKHPDLREVVIKRPKETKEKPPKRPENPYKLFLQSELNKEEISDKDKAEFKDVCRDKWRHMPDENKLDWIKLAEEQYKKYEEELKAYMAKYPEYTPKSQPHKNFLSKEEMSLKDKLAGKPKKPPNTAYALFVSMALQSSDLKYIPPKERWSHTSGKWKGMTDEEKDQYKLLLTQVHEQYQKDFQAYLSTLPDDKRQQEILQNRPKKLKKTTETQPSTSGTKPKTSSSKSSFRSPNVKNNPVPPPCTPYKYFVEKYKGDNPKEAWKRLNISEKHKYEEELVVVKEKYIKDFEAYLKSLTKDELAAFCESRNAQEEYTSSDDSEHSDHESSDGSTNSSESDNESDEH
ncbi:hypothetical protein ABEB36_011370 [Hypothenemus hampei]|uniref:HMG box domain-containing protein n=1 Tax=Hypothenemus hampei TaxID=57062 RepID=A0ABD1EF76_HYPHA